MIKRPSAFVLAVCLLLVGGSAAWAYTSQRAAGTIAACVTKSSGAVRIPSTGGCRATERKVTWNVAGVRGPAGPRGLVGAQGVPGPQGANGPAGAPGAVGATGPAGSQGEAGAAGPQGEPGATGPEGAAGAAGAAGPQGNTGPQGATGPQGQQGPQGPAGISNVRATQVPAGTVINGDGVVLAQLQLSRANNYVVSAAVTATSTTNGSLQCQLARPEGATWDDLAEINVSARTTVSLEYAYPASSSLPTTMTVYLACLTNGFDYIVDVGHLYAWQVGSINGNAPTGPVILPSRVQWESFD